MKIYKCEHRKPSSFVKSCVKVQMSRMNCSEDDLKDKPLRSSKQVDNCPDCKDEGYSRIQERV